VDGSFTTCLRQASAQSIDGFALSNICEWLSGHEIWELFTQIVRTAAPGATVCFRNFVGWTEVPRFWSSVVVEDRAYGERLIATDRSTVQRRIAVCTVRGGGT
jgi:S-adenosylmethionine:diacylglycerol 3-amino-3-carboxypropyl transferase